MSPRSPLLPRLVRRARARLERGGDEGGFMLVEVMVAITLMTVIMSAVGVEYVNGIVVSAHQRSSAVASQIASSAMSDLRSLDPSDLLIGRTSAGVLAQRGRLVAITKVKPFLSTNTGSTAYDNGPAPQGAPVPTTAVSQSASGETFRVDKYLECQAGSTESLNADGTKKATCAPVTGADAMNTIRAVVVVGWDDRGCPVDVGCAFVTSSLIDAHADPTFDLNQPLPAAPVVQAPGDQNVAVGDVVSLQLLVQDGKGAAPFSWAQTAGALPTGLSISPAGLISGTVGGTPQTTTQTVTVTDAFVRKDDETIKWIVAPRLAIAAVPDQVSFVRSAITPVTLSASGGSGTGYVYSDPGSTLPAGLSLNATTGKITGTPTTVKTSNVTLTVTDSVSRTATISFTWNVVYPPIGLSQPGNQVATQNRPETIQLTATGGSESYSYAATGLPSTMTIGASTGRITGTPTSTGTTSVTVTVTDTVTGSTATSTFNLTVVAPPTVTSPGDQATTKGGSVNVAVTSTCLNGPCTYTASALPTGLSINASTGRISGTVATNAATVTVRITATDSAGGTGTSAAFTWTVNNAPVATAIPNRTTAYNTNPNAAFAGFFSGGTGPYTYSATGLPSGLTMNASTGVVSGTTATAYSRSTPTIRVTDASGQQASASMVWYVSSLSLTMPATNTTASPGTTGSRVLSNSQYTSGGTTPYSYTVTGLPTGWSLNNANNTVSGPLNRANTVMVVTVTDGTGASLTANWTFVVN